MVMVKYILNILVLIAVLIPQGRCLLAQDKPRHTLPDDPAKLASRVTKLADTPGLSGWYDDAIRNVDDGIVNEAEKFEKYRDLGQLAQVHEKMTFLWKDTQTVKVETDMWICEGSELTWTELKKGHLTVDHLSQVERNLQGVVHTVENIPSKGALRKLYYEIGGTVQGDVGTELTRLAREYQVPIYVRDVTGSVVTYA